MIWDLNNLQDIPDHNYLSQNLNTMVARSNHMYYHVLRISPYVPNVACACEFIELHPRRFWGLEVQQFTFGVSACSSSRPFVVERSV